MTLLILFNMFGCDWQLVLSIRGLTRLDNQSDCRSPKHKVSRLIMSLQRPDSLLALTRINESKAPWEGRRWGETILSIVIQLEECQYYAGPVEDITTRQNTTRWAILQHACIWPGVRLPITPFCWDKRAIDRVREHCHSSFVGNNGDRQRGLTLQPPLTCFERVLFRVSIWYCLCRKPNPVV